MDRASASGALRGYSPCRNMLDRSSESRILFFSVIFGINGILNRDACAYLGQGGKASSEGTSHLRICILLHRGLFRSVNSFPEE